MAALTFNKCCCCIDLKVGCFILGYINLILNIIIFGMSLLAVVAINVVAASNQNDQTPEQQEAFKTGMVVANVILVITLIFLALNLAFAIVLLVGLHKEKPGHVKAYIIYDVIFIIISVIMFIVQVSGSATTAGGIIQSLISIGFSIYILLVFRSYYYKMKEGGNNGAIYSA